MTEKNLQALTEILEEIVNESSKYRTNQNSYDTFECRYCGSEVNANSTDKIVHASYCIIHKAKDILEEINNEI